MKPKRSLKHLGLPVWLLISSAFLSAEPEHDHAAHEDPAESERALKVGHDDHSGHDHAAHDDEVEHENHTGHDHAAHAKDAAQEDHAGHDHAAPDAHEDIVQVSDEVLREFDIQVEPVRSAELYQTVTLPGEIQFNREAFAYVTPRYAGVVLTIEKRLASPVEKGEVLATLENTETLRPFSLKSPLDGTVVNYDLSPGQAVEAGAMLFSVSNLDTVWADLRVYQRDLFKLKVGQPIRIECGYDDEFFLGRIDYIAPMIDQHTRTGLARVIVDNKDGHWMPGQFIKGIVSVDTHKESLVVPRSAVLTYEGSTVVFVRTEKGFEPRPLQLGHSDAEFYEVESGLTPGEEIATRNAISLKAELGKASFGGHEGHVH